jgi:hypothetical protein
VRLEFGGVRVWTSATRSGELAGALLERGAQHRPILEDPRGALLLTLLDDLLEPVGDSLGRFAWINDAPEVVPRVGDIDRLPSTDRVCDGLLDRRRDVGFVRGQLEDLTLRVRERLPRVVNLRLRGGESLLGLVMRPPSHRRRLGRLRLLECGSSRRSESCGSLLGRDGGRSPG